jgi:membrane protease subunit HflK
VIEDARVYANETIPQARGDAQIIVNEALGSYEMRVNKARGETGRFVELLREYERDKETTRTRLYIETMERVLARNKVVIVNDDSKVTIIEE